MYLRTIFLGSTAAAALGAAFAVEPVRADSFVIRAGQTETAMQEMDGDDETGTVEEGGVISTSGNNVDGIRSTGLNARIANGGSISTDGDFSDGIRSAGPDARITNNGSISTDGDSALGIYSDGDNVSIDNSGTIVTWGDGVSDGIFAEGLNARIVNSGDISTHGTNVFGVYIEGDDSWITNSGTISTAADSSNAIYTVGDNVRINNSGTVSTKGDDAQGIVANGLNARITNSGSILTAGNRVNGIHSQNSGAQIANNGTIELSGDGSYGIWAQGADATISHSGTIRATHPGGFAIGISGPNATLNLLPGWVLEGDLFVRQTVADTATLNIATGRSTNIRFANAGHGGAGALPSTINAGGMPFFVDETNMVVATADVTAPRAAGASLNNLAGGVFGAIGARGTSGTLSAPVEPLAFAPPTSARWDGAFAALEPAPSRRAWLGGFGGYAIEGASGASLDHRHALGGFVAGMDLSASTAAATGLFFGGAWGNTDVPGSQAVDEASAFGGAYATYALGETSIDFGLLIGWSSFDSSRLVVDNTVAGGIATARASYGGFLISPQVGVTRAFEIGSRRIEAGASARYAGLFLQSYAESGTAANLAFDARQIHQIVSRASLSMPFEQSHADGGATRIVPTLGVEGTVQFGRDRVVGTLAGTGIGFDAGNGGKVAAFGSVRLEHETAGNLTFFAGAEGTVGQGNSRRLLANLGASLRF